jgi:outer membrane protein assembly factor BamB
MGTSFSDIGNRNFDGTVLKYLPDGSLDWEFRMDLDRPDGFGEIALDDAGNLYLSGGWENEMDADGILVSLTPDGQERWRHIYDDTAGWDFQEAMSVMIGRDGLLYVGLDWQYDDDAVYDYTVAVHDTNGAKLDQWRYDTGSHSDTFDSLGGWAMDQAGDIFIAGYSYADATRADFTVMRIAAGANCTADFNTDGQVNTLDVLAFLNAWSAGC